MFRRTVVLAGAVGVLAVAGGTAAAYVQAKAITEPNGKGVITLCYDTSTGRPRMVSSGSRCGSGEQRLAWRQHPSRPVVHQVGGHGEPAYTLAWKGLDSPPYGNLSYYRDSSRVVHLTGLACWTGGSGVCQTAWGSGRNPVFTLPPGFRPATRAVFSVQSYGGGTYYQARVDVLRGGVVEIMAPPIAGAAWVSFDGISFLTR